MPAGHRWVILGVCIFCFGLVHLHRLGFAPLIPVFVVDLGITYTSAGLIQTAYFWTYALTQIPIGLMTDRWGPGRVMAVFLLILSAGALMFSASHSYGTSVTARALVGLGAAAVWVPPGCG